MLDDKGDKGFARYLVSLTIPFVLLGIGSLPIAWGEVVMFAGGPFFLWVGLLIIVGVVALAGVIGFTILMMMAEAGPFWDRCGPVL